MMSVTGTEPLATRRHGEIQLILGPMFSGKTSELMRRVRRYRLFNKCLLLSYKVPSLVFARSLCMLSSTILAYMSTSLQMGLSATLAG